MITDILNAIGHFVSSMIESLGYAGIVLGMAIESVNIPLPSEVIMPFSGALVAEGKFDFWLVVLAGAVGNGIGSVINYYLGAKGGRPFVDKHGHKIFMHPKDVERADRWFQRYGLWAVFLTRMLPVVRTFISFPAGMARVPMLPFIGLTFAGSFLWSALLTYVGVVLGRNYETVIKPVFHSLDAVIGLLLVVALIVYIRHALKLRRGNGNA
jgi:membrane protein DedA with SNARE-associated domain